MVKSMANHYHVSIRGPIPPGLIETISAAHARALKLEEHRGTQVEVEQATTRDDLKEEANGLTLGEHTLPEL